MRLRVRSLPLLSGLTIRRCRELWCRLQTQLGSRVAVSGYRLAAVAPIPPLAWKPPYAMGVALEKAKSQRKKKFLFLDSQFHFIEYVELRSSRRGAVVNESD